MSGGSVNGPELRNFFEDGQFIDQYRSILVSRASAIKKYCGEQTEPSISEMGAFLSTGPLSTYSLNF